MAINKLTNEEINAAKVEGKGNPLKGTVAANQAVFDALPKKVNEKLNQVIDEVNAAGASASAHFSNKSNPHSVTKAQVGLGNVDNTADMDKPVSNAVAAELIKKADKAEVDTALGQKADKTELDTKADKSAVDMELSAKADKAEVTALESNVNTALAKKADADAVDTALGQKADKGELDTKADKLDTYTKTEVNAALDLKADKLDTYIKAEVDEALGQKADKSELEGLVTEAELDEALLGLSGGNVDLTNYYTKQATNDLLGVKADKADVYTKGEIDASVGQILEDISDSFITQGALNDYWTSEEVNAKLALKADKSNVYTKTEVDAKTRGIESTLNGVGADVAALQTELGTKADKSEVDSITAQLGTKADKSEVNVLASAVSGLGAVATENKVPISKGGTGADNRVSGFNNLAFLGVNPITSPSDDVIENWKTLGTGYAFFNTAGQLTDQPYTYGYLETLYYSGNIVQHFYPVNAKDATYRRVGYITSGWRTSWVKMLDENDGATRKTGNYAGSGGTAVSKTINVGVTPKFVLFFGTNAATSSSTYTGFYNAYSGRCCFYLSTGTVCQYYTATVSDTNLTMKTAGSNPYFNLSGYDYDWIAIG